MTLTTATSSWSLSAAELKEFSANVPAPLIADLLPSCGVVTFAGEPGCGKSFVALSWACAVAEGLPWFDKVTGDPKSVVYVLGEGWARFGDRVAAWEQANDHVLSDRLQFVDGASQGLDLTDEAKADDFVDNLAGLDPALVILDTFSMLAHVRSENDNAEVAAVFAVAHKIVREVGCTVVLVHHVSKGASQVRGATSFKGNADTVVVAYRAKREDDPTFTLSTDPRDDGKQRDGEPVRLPGFSITSPGVLSRDAVAVQAAETSNTLALLMGSTGTEGVI